MCEAQDLKHSRRGRTKWINVFGGGFILVLSPPEGPGLGGGARDGSSAPLPRERKPSWRDWKSCWNFDCRARNGSVSLVFFLALDGSGVLVEKQVPTEGSGRGSYQDVKETDRNPSLL